MVIDFFSEVFGWLVHRPEVVGKIVLVSVLLAFVSVVMMVVAITKMSPDYFVSRKPPSESWRGRHPLLSIFFKVLKSLTGLTLLISGIAMLVLPGQGVLTILVGISLLDFPGKRKMERYMVQRRHVLKTINWIRAKAKQAPVIVDPKKRSA